MNNSERICVYCGAALPPDSRFCEKCGRPVLPKAEAVANHPPEAFSPQALPGQMPSRQAIPAAAARRARYLIGGGMAAVIVLLAGMGGLYFYSGKKPQEIQNKASATAFAPAAAEQPKLASLEAPPPEKIPARIQTQTSETQAPRDVCAGTVTLFDNWNKGACARTNLAGGRLSEKALATKIVLWSDTRIEKNSLNGILRGPGVYLPLSTQRGACQGSWCEEIVPLNEVLPAGDYTFQTNLKSLCQNKTSRGIGYVRFEGCAQP